MTDAPVAANELLSLVPLSLLAAFYLLSNILFCNRLLLVGYIPCLTRTQVLVAIVFYPVWIALNWIQNLATARGDVFFLVLAGIVSTVAGWWAAVAVFNDGFVASNQQIASLGPTLIINLLWLWNNYLFFAP